MSVCGIVCVRVLYRNPNRWMDCNETCHSGGPQGREGSWVGFSLAPMSF